jgi:hypothetical protein
MVWRDLLPNGKKFMGGEENSALLRFCCRHLAAGPDEPIPLSYQALCRGLLAGDKNRLASGGIPEAQGVVV